MIRDMVMNNVIPMDILEFLPIQVREVGKSRFDQLFDAAMYLAFPGYGKKVRKSLTGDENDHDMRAWKVILPREFMTSHVIIKAKTYQEAFAMACDYACRVSLRIKREIPLDLTVRVKFMGDRTLDRFFEIRTVNGKTTRLKRKLKERTFSPKQIMGARLAAMGHPNQTKDYSISKYVEKKDLERVREGAGLVKKTSIVTEHYKRD